MYRRASAARGLARLTHAHAVVADVGRRGSAVASDSGAERIFFLSQQHPCTENRVFTKPGSGQTDLLCAETTVLYSGRPRLLSAIGPMRCFCGCAHAQNGAAHSSIVFFVLSFLSVSPLSPPCHLAACQPSVLHLCVSHRNRSVVAL
jgi:hypothetical protein